MWNVKYLLTKQIEVGIGDSQHMFNSCYLSFLQSALKFGVTENLVIYQGTPPTKNQKSVLAVSERPNKLMTEKYSSKAILNKKRKCYAKCKHFWHCFRAKLQKALMSTFTTPTQGVQIPVYTSLVLTPPLCSWHSYNLSFLKSQLNYNPAQRFRSFPNHFWPKYQQVTVA